ncbi:MAG TPA: hypothetical protein VGB30_03175 [bacterium]|jgi:hypothetical protein
MSQVRLSTGIILLVSIIIMSSVAGCSSSVNNPAFPGIDNRQDNMTSGRNLDLPESNQDQTHSAQVSWVNQIDTPSEPDNNSYATADLIYDYSSPITRHPFKKVTGTVDAASDSNDYYAVQFDPDITPGNRAIYASLNWTGSAWLNVYIYKADLTPVAYLNENTPGPKILWKSNLSPLDDLYYIRVRAATGNAGYTLDLGINRDYETGAGDNAIEDDPTDVNDNYWQLFPITNFVGIGNDVNDYYRINLVNTENVGLNIKLDWLGSANADLNVYLYDETYAPIKVSNGTSKPEAIGITLTELPASKDYYIRVKAGVGTGIYELDIKFQEAPSVWDPNVFLIPVEIPIPPEPDPDPWYSHKFNPKDYYQAHEPIVVIPGFYPWTPDISL